MKDILFLAHRIPFPADRGDKIRSNHILKALVEMAPVHVACFADDAADLAEEAALADLAASHLLVQRTKPVPLAGLEALKCRLPVSLTAFRHPAIADYVARVLASGKIGAIYVFSGQMGQYVPDDWAGRLVVDFVDADSAKFAAYAAARGAPVSAIYAREARLLAVEEARLAARADVSLLSSEAEAALFAERLPPDVRQSCVVRALSNGIDTQGFDPEHSHPEPALAALAAPRLIFTGQMDYAPNAAAVERVARRILPALRAHLPEASFHIVGRNPTRRVQALARLPGIHVWGRVPDMRPYLAAADIALIPLEIARGIQNKALEAMAMALPVVLTSATATGIPARDGEHFRVADSDAEIIAALTAISQDQTSARAMGQAARHFVRSEMSWARALAPLREMMTGAPHDQRSAA